MHPVRILLFTLAALAATTSFTQLLRTRTALPITTFNEKNNITRKDPNFPFTGDLFTGFIIVDNTTQANIFYQVYAYNQTTLSTKAPLIIWLEGGPGCSSAYGNYVELGPVHIYNGSTPNTYTYQHNPHTWNQFGHLLYLDNPTGTGFSRANGLNVSSTDQASKQFGIFLARFYQLYPELVDCPLYIVGESYAGKYVPVFTYDLLHNETFSSQITIKGIAIGDGWSDPIRQLPTYGAFGYAAGLLDARSRDMLNRQEVQGVKDIQNGNYWEATNISNELLTELDIMAGNISAFDYRELINSNEGSETSDSDAYMNWLNTTQAQAFLEIPYEYYFGCASDVSDNFDSDSSRSVADLYPDLFSRVHVLLYNGQDDENVNYAGVVRYLNALKWDDVENFRQSKRVPWKLTNGTTAGLVKAYGNLTFLLVFKAGHFVPAKQPEAAAEMIYNFINEIPFA